MPPRLVFGVAATLAGLVSTILGSAFAWSAGTSAPGSVAVGTNSAVVYITNVSGAVIGPNGGSPVHIANVRVENTGTLPLKIVSATVTPFDVDPHPPGLTTCAPGDFVGIATDLPTGSFGPPPPVPQFSNPPFKVKLGALFSAPSDCQGDVVHYDVAVMLTNP